jgi:hypothetical protein
MITQQINRKLTRICLVTETLNLAWFCIFHIVFIAVHIYIDVIRLEICYPPWTQTLNFVLTEWVLLLLKFTGLVCSVQ